MRNLLIEDHELIIDFYFGQHLRASNVFIYTPPEATLIPLQAFLDALELPIEVDPISMKAFGWFITEKNRFELDVRRHTLYLRDKEIKIPAKALIFSDDFDLYVDINLLQQWLPITINLDTSRLRVLISSTEPLPFELKYEREKFRERALRKSPTDDLPIIADQYDWLGLPTIDISVGHELIDMNGAFYNIQASGDIAGFEGRFSASKPANNPSKQLLTFNKRPNTPDEDFGYNLKDVSIGDVYAISNDLVFLGGEGSGVNLQFGQLDSSSDFGKTIIEGNNTPGWEVELYKNGVLIDFTQVDSNGRYRFKDVPVEYGENVFDITLYGPQGQKISRRESVRVGDQMIPAGENQGRISYVNVGDSLLNDYEDVSQEKKAHIEWLHGFTDWLAAGLAYSHFKLDKDGLSGINLLDQDTDETPPAYINYAQMTLLGAFPDLALGINTAMNDEEGWASAINGQTSISSSALSFLHKHYEEFVSDRNRNGDLKDEMEFRLSGFFKAYENKSIHYNYVLTHESYDVGYDRSQLENRLGFQAYSGSVNLSTIFNHTESLQNRLLGEARFSRPMGRTSYLRTSAIYNLYPNVNINTIALSLSWRPTDRIQTQMGIDSDLTGATANSLNMSASSLLDHFTLSVTSESRDDGYNAIVFTAEMSLAAESAKQWSVSGNNRSESGRALVRTFLDHDRSDNLTVGDEIISRMKFRGRNSWRDLETNEQGLLYLNELSANSPNRLIVDEGSMPDPFWKSKVTEAKVISHAGGINVIDIPVIVTVEVEGSITLERNGKQKPIGGLAVTITTESGLPVTTALTEFDGYYVIPGLAPGNYILSFDPAGLKRYQVDPPAPIHFTAHAEQGVVYIDPIVLE